MHLGWSILALVLVSDMPGLFILIVRVKFVTLPPIHPTSLHRRFIRYHSNADSLASFPVEWFIRYHPDDVVDFDISCKADRAAWRARMEHLVEPTVNKILLLRFRSSQILKLYSLHFLYLCVLSGCCFADCCFVLVIALIFDLMLLPDCPERGLFLTLNVAFRLVSPP
jgi:hypothetical protein